jgi:two-component system, LuxR family, response regulator FixJ
MAISVTVNPTDNVAVIEDDTSMREALGFQLETAGYRVVLHASAESFLEDTGSQRFDCLLVDLCLPKMNGLQLLAQIKRSLPFVSIVLITGHGDMSTGVRAMHEGAADCLQKPIDDYTLLQAIVRAADLSRSNRATHLLRLELEKRESSLTPRERQVFGLITAGLLNKQVGAELGPSEWTVKKHRARVMSKMGADSLAELVRMSELLGIRPGVRPQPSFSVTGQTLA